MNSNMEYNNEKIAGTINTTVGDVKEAVGNATGDSEMATKGSLQKTKGQAQTFSAAVQDVIKKGQSLLGIKRKN